MTTDALKRLKSAIVKNIDLTLIVVFFVFTAVSAGNALLNSSPNWYSILMVSSIVLMLAGQVFLITSFGQAYFLYFYSFFVAVSISVLFWMSTHVPYSDYVYPFYAIIVGALVGISFIVHLKTRKRIGTIPLIPTYSIFLLGLLIALSTSGFVSNTITNTSLSNLFILAIAIFVITSIFGLNNAYRTLKLNKSLKINNRNNYLTRIKDDLNSKYTDKDAQADIDLLTYYLSSSLESFVFGDFDRSYIDAFKIIDNHGTAFKRIYTISIDENEWKKLSDIRNNLSHAKISSGKNETKTEQLRALKDLQRGLFEETLNVLRMIRFEFIEKALEEKQPK